MGAWIATGAPPAASLQTTMQVAADRTDASTAIHQIFAYCVFGTQPIYRADQIFVARRREKMSKHSIRAGDVAGLLVRLAQLKEKARADGAGLCHHRPPRGRIGRLLDLLRSAARRNRSDVVDAASILTARRRRERRPTG